VTEEQAQALGRLTRDFRAKRWDCLLNPFDLPAGYVQFDLYDGRGQRLLFGGIAPDGAVST